MVVAAARAAVAADRVHRVVVFGKMPPIQGGVSARTLAFVTALREQGEHVTVVTNAASVEPAWAAHLDAADIARLADELVGVDVRDVTADPIPFHIPQSSAFETRLIGAGLSAVRDADLVIGWYFQPYGVAAALIARMLGKPCVLMHAGSDLARLGSTPTLAEAYRKIFEECWVVSTSARSRPLLEPLFDHQRIIDASPGYRLPRYFNGRRHGREGLWHYLAVRAHATLPEWQLRSDLTDMFTASWAEPPPQSAFLLGVYGKLGRQKGTFDLLDALEVLAPPPDKFRLLMVTGGGREALLGLAERIARSPLLRRIVHVVPFIPPWQVPRLIDACDAVAFLERGFDVEIHAPQVPLEVLWRGTPLLCSDEIVAKQSFRQALLPWVNYIPAGDPRDATALADVIRRAIATPNLRDLGRAGAGLARSVFGGPAPRDNFVKTLRVSGLLPSLGPR